MPEQKQNRINKKVAERKSGPAWPADRVERWPIERITPYPGNPRIHSDAELDLLAEAMRRRGVTTAVLVDEKGVLISGHGRLEAARRAGLTELVVNIAVGWSDKEKRAHRIWDNQSVLMGKWSLDPLRFELGALHAGGFDLAPLGFDSAQLASILDARPGARRARTRCQRRLPIPSRAWAIFGAWGGIG
jgi:ParB-like nuclease domain